MYRFGEPCGIRGRTGAPDCCNLTFRRAAVPFFGNCLKLSQNNVDN